MADLHTPGVLSVAETFCTHDHPNRYWRTYIDAPLDGLVAQTFGATQDEAEANAARIVHRVNVHDDLVAALKLWAAYQVAIDSDDPEQSRPLSAYSDAMDATYAALTKAVAPSARADDAHTEQQEQSK